MSESWLAAARVLQLPLASSLVYRPLAILTPICCLQSLPKTCRDEQGGGRESAVVFHNEKGLVPLFRYRSSVLGWGHRQDKSPDPPQCEQVMGAR